jgi:hypothetical protein
LRAVEGWRELLQVVYAAPGEGLRLRGALGPLQTEGVDGTLSWTLKPVEGGTSLTWSYVVGGYIPDARRAASAPQKLRRGQIPGAVGTLKPTLPGDGPRERVQNAHRSARASRPVNEVGAAHAEVF